MLRKIFLAVASVLAFASPVAASQPQTSGENGPAGDLHTYHDDVDWKMYGAANVGELSACFFDAKSVSQTNDEHVRVWTKCLPKRDLDNFSKENDRGRYLIDQAALKLLEGYIPPVVAIGRLKSDKSDVTSTIAREQVADLGDIPPISRMYVELNCSNKSYRRLSTYIKANGQTYDDQKTSAWAYAPPETAIGSLQEIVCADPKSQAR